MAGAYEKRLKGRILMVQEDRFRLAGDTGQGFLFTLWHKARVSQEDLQRWHGAGTRVVVTYTGTPNLAGGVAHRIEPLTGRP